MAAGYLGGLARVGAGLKADIPTHRLDLRRPKSCVINLHIHNFVEAYVMARVQLVMPDTDKDRYVRQARREGLSLSEWLLLAAREHLDRKQKLEKFKSEEEMRAFFEECHERAGPGREPDWEEHLAVINESKMKGLPKP